ncbi:MAG: hypothetical protein CL908_09590 [Deltaproteobacteria bacterium]|jgi:hypothetical protein|nr:hypothetical protein [Deltaproteobacteria bacterium]
MADYLIGAANILGGVFLQVLIHGKIRPTEASAAFWSTWRAEHPSFTRYGPPFLVAFGIVRIAIGLLGSN